jgi:hypothetical protein
MAEPWAARRGRWRPYPVGGAIRISVSYYHSRAAAILGPAQRLLGRRVGSDLFPRCGCPARSGCMSESPDPQVTSPPDRRIPRSPVPQVTRSPERRIRRSAGRCPQVSLCGDIRGGLGGNHKEPGKRHRPSPGLLISSRRLPARPKPQLKRRGRNCSYFRLLCMWLLIRPQLSLSTAVAGSGPAIA